jgi:hypothetical protein
MRFVGVVMYAKRQDHEVDGSPGPEQVTDVRLDGKVAGCPVWIEVSVPTSEAAAYYIGRRVVVTVKPS